MKKTAESFQALVSIMDRLRSPEGCPWDREQTMETLRTYLIEEVYEVVEAIDRKDTEALREELGDLLFHIIFLCRIATERRDFSIWDVIQGISAKMVGRHPHVFGREKVSSPREVEKNWYNMKEKEKDHRRSVLDGIPQHLPALLRAYRLTERASRVGFDWERPGDVLKKLGEEIDEFGRALSQGKETAIQDEMGDVFFVLVNLARLTGTNPEDALRRTTQKFIRRFHHVEESLKRSQKSLKEASLEEMDRLWEQAKGRE